jgi:hypothetical protein
MTQVLTQDDMNRADVLQGNVPLYSLWVFSVAGAVFCTPRCNCRIVVRLVTLRLCARAVNTTLEADPPNNVHEHVASTKSHLHLGWSNPGQYRHRGDRPVSFVSAFASRGGVANFLPPPTMPDGMIHGTEQRWRIIRSRRIRCALRDMSREIELLG